MSRFFVLLFGIIAGYVAFNFGSRIRQNLSGLLERDNDSDDHAFKNGGDGLDKESQPSTRQESEKMPSAGEKFDLNPQSITLAEAIRRRIADFQPEEAKSEVDAQPGEPDKKSGA